VWMVAIEIQISSERYLLINLYHSPNNMDAAFLSFLDEYMERISDYSGTIILMGDFNLNLLQSVAARQGWQSGQCPPKTK
jgi:endonuclease/exonuclease/phosphatase (EEP) superfamily protein YafD